MSGAKVQVFVADEPEEVARGAAAELDAARIRAVQLDEYVGVRPTDERAFFGWVEREVLGPLAIRPERVIGLRGDASDLAAECERYERAVRDAGGIDLAGPTLEASAGYWGDRGLVPARGITAGMRVLLAARETILVATGERKRAILRAALEGPVTPEVPASLPRTIDRVRVRADRAAWSA